MDTLRATNCLVQEEQPWLLAKSDPVRRDWVLALVFETLRICGLLLQPCVPSLSSKLLDRLNVPIDERGWHAAKPELSRTCRPLGEDRGVLISKIYAPKIVKSVDPKQSKKKKKPTKDQTIKS